MDCKETKQKIKIIIQKSLVKESKLLFKTLLNQNKKNFWTSWMINEKFSIGYREKIEILLKIHRFKKISKYICYIISFLMIDSSYLLKYIKCKYNLLIQNKIWQSFLTLKLSQRMSMICV